MAVGTFVTEAEPTENWFPFYAGHPSIYGCSRSRAMPELRRCGTFDEFSNGPQAWYGVSGAFQHRHMSFTGSESDCCWHGERYFRMFIFKNLWAGLVHFSGRASSNKADTRLNEKLLLLEICVETLLPRRQRSAAEPTA